MSNDNNALFSTQPDIDETTGDLTYESASGATGSATVSVYLMDDGGTANGGVDTSATQQFTITVTPPNAAPVASGQSVSTNEDTLKTITLSATDADGDTLTFSIVSGPSNGSLGSLGSVTCVGNPSTCTVDVDYTPAANFNGPDSFTFKANDGQADSNTATVDITVDAVNDAPSFTSGGNVTVDEDSGAYSAAWATGMSAGPADESGQTLSFSIQSNSNPSLFSVAPSIAPDGTLSFTPAANANGSANLSVVLQDNGGVANGGADTSAPVNFTITVTAVNDAPVNTVPAAQSVNEDTDLVFSSGNSNALSVADIDAASGSIQVTVSALNGTITPATGSGATIGGSGTSSATITGTLTQVNNALNGLKYKGNTNFNQTRGSETLTIVTDDQGQHRLRRSARRYRHSQHHGQRGQRRADGLAKNFNAQANMKITGLTGLLTGATDPDTGDSGYTATFTVGTVSATTPAGGVISNLNTATGTFDFDPPPGASGNVTFTYTVCDSGNPAPPVCGAPATVTVNVAGPVIWFVNPAAGVNGSGTLNSPFNNLASAAAVDASTHRIFVYTGTATTGITLNTDEWLIGQGVTGTTFDALFGITPPIGTIARPSINGTRPVIEGNVAMATSDAVRGLNIQPAPGTQGLSASGATSLTVNEVSVTTSNAAAVNLSSSGGTISLTMVNANGGSRGIVLDNTTGTFTVTGSGGTCTDANTGGCSGGVIQNMTGADDSGATPVGTGIVLNNAAGVSLTRMYIHDHSNYGIRGTSVNGFNLNNSVVSGVNGTNVATPFNDGSILFAELSGTSAITNSAISGGYQRNISVDNTTGTLTLTISNSSIHNTGNAQGDDGILIEIGGGNATLNVTNNTFSAHGGDHLNVSLLGSPTVDLTFSGNLWTGGHPIGLGQGLFILAASFNGTFTYDILNNGTVANPLVGNNSGGAIHVNKGSGTGTFSGTISNNVIGDPAVNSSGSLNASGIDVEAHGAGGSHTVLITNNLVRQFHNDGILILAGEGNAAFNVTMTGNTVSNPDATIVSFHGVHFNIGTLPTDALVACLDVRNNTLTNAANEANGGVDLRMRQRQLTTVRMPGYAGANNDNTAVQNFLIANGNAVTTILASNTVATGGGGYLNTAGGAACPQPAP
ncbi:MAG: cadherin-like domain-containing protein [Chloroflexi bacterium]|nr:cadherin-like domain-containing protein [Chloroflexota bacterium]